MDGISQIVDGDGGSTSKGFQRKNGWDGGIIDRVGDFSDSFEEQDWVADRPADVGRLLSPTELRHQSRDLKETSLSGRAMRVRLPLVTRSKLGMLAS